MPCADYFLPGIVDDFPEVTWDNLVLPKPVIKSLREYTFWVDYRCKVEEEWGSKIERGPIALFSGPSGTGKTLAARVLANALGLPLLRVDLGVMAGKYIGETEKNLDALFDALSNEPMLLLFDDIDSFLIQGEEAEDSHHCYAKLQIPFLLSRLERYKGPTILTIKQPWAIDPALLRGFQMVIDFPMPDKRARLELWRRHIPPRAPISEDVDLDHLARRRKLSGGQIRNVALHAAFLAAAESIEISSVHISSALKTELSKTAKT